MWTLEWDVDELAKKMNNEYWKLYIMSQDANMKFIETKTRCKFVNYKHTGVYIDNTSPYVTNFLSWLSASDEEIEYLKISL